MYINEDSLVLQRKLQQERDFGGCYRFNRKRMRTQAERQTETCPGLDSRLEPTFLLSPANIHSCFSCMSQGQRHPYESYCILTHTDESQQGKILNNVLFLKYRYINLDFDYRIKIEFTGKFGEWQDMKREQLCLKLQFVKIYNTKPYYIHDLQFTTHSLTPLSDIHDNNQREKQLYFTLLFPF